MCSKCDLTKFDYLSFFDEFRLKLASDFTIFYDRKDNRWGLSSTTDCTDKKNTIKYCPYCGRKLLEDKSEEKTAIEYLNEKAGTKYKLVESNLKFVRARLSNYSLDDIKSVVDKKVAEWKGTEMAKYLRPETLFNATKFESYINQQEFKPVKTKTNTKNYKEREYTSIQLKELIDDIETIKL